MASPGQIVDAGEALAPPPPLGRAAAAALLTLADFETPLWIGPSFAGSGVQAYLKFHTGALLASAPEHAAFALADAESDALDFKCLSQGTAEYPDRSTTLILQARRLGPGPGCVWSAPAFAAPRRWMSRRCRPIFSRNGRPTTRAFRSGSI